MKNLKDSKFQQLYESIINEKEKPDFLKRDDKFRYQLLDRLKTDCEYYLNHGNRNPKHLWADNEKEQIEDMKLLYKSFKGDKTPKWITWDDILKYEKQMIKDKK